MKQFSTESGLKRSVLHRFCWLSVYRLLHPKRWTSYIVCVDDGESDFEAAGIAPKGKSNPAFAGPRPKDRLGGWSSCFASGLIKGSPFINNLILCFLLRDILRRSDASKSEVICARVDIALAARANDVARTVLIVAQERAAAMHAFLFIRLGRIEW